MKPGTFIEQAERDAKVVDAVHHAQYALVIHNGLMVRSEGEEWQMEFEREIDRLTEAMTLLGIDMSKPLIAPVRGDPLEDED
ncbi:hypothetical protein [Paraburkholderia sp. BL10I2N1]|uniref:hypothetical protein n=1 Tax=Paraburkholderia sp. BL10I2N1 TaxID=1938796 RepID=UPI00106121BA|nr:hypothetical protein [Paraburkholderia sp. BL10I2N1]